MISSTDRISLRRLKIDDLADFQAYRQDENVARYQGWSTIPDSEALAFLKEMNEASFFQPGVWFQIAIAEKESDKLIGDIGICLSKDQTQAEIGFSLRTESQGKGFGREFLQHTFSYIFEQTSAQKVVAVTDLRNIACIRLLERCDMTRVEQLESVFKGEACVEYVYEVLRSVNIR